MRRRRRPQNFFEPGNKPGGRPLSSQEAAKSRDGLGPQASKERAMSKSDRRDGVDRRTVLECMTWAGTGVLWTIAGGVPHSLGIMGEAAAAEARGLTFLQLSDSHVGFDKAANPDALGTLQEAIAKVNALPTKPAFAIHTGDISHLSLESQFDDADRVISQSRLDVHYVPGEHDFLDPDMKFFHDRYGKGTKGAGWYSFDANGVHFIGLVNVVNLKAGGLGDLGNEQLEWLENDVKNRSASTPIVVFAHIPLWTIYPDWGWGTDDAAQALSYLKRFGSVTVLNGHIHQVMQKVEGNVTFHTARSTAFPQPAPGTAPSPGPMKVPDDQLRTMLGIANVTFKQNEQRLAIVDAPLKA
jgi:3',5'-cyclic AMP phosphodiesterase CpdA